MNQLLGFSDTSELPFQHPQTHEYPFWMFVSTEIENELTIVLFECTPAYELYKGMETISVADWQAKTLELVAETGVLPDDESYEAHCHIQAHYALVDVAFKIYNECYGVSEADE